MKITRYFRISQYLVLRARGAVLTCWIRLWGGQVGRGLMADKHVRLRQRPGHGLRIGDHVFISVGVVIDVKPEAELIIDDHVKVSHYAVIGVADSVRIGAHSGIAEFASIRDSDHDLSPGVIMMDAPVTTAPVVLGEDVWIGRGATVLSGVTIGAHAVVAANAVVLRDVASGAVVGGVPAKVLKMRDAADGQPSS